MSQNSTTRIDKWLWSIRAYKTRAVASEACKSNKITINGRVVKASADVKIGDIVTIKKLPVVYSFRVLDAISGRVGAKSVFLAAENLTPQSEIDKLDLRLSPHMSRERGSGRPTKKERRDIDDLMDNFFFDDDLESTSSTSSSIDSVE